MLSAGSSRCSSNMWNCKLIGSRTLVVLLLCGLMSISQIECIKLLKGRQKPPAWNHQRTHEGHPLNPGNRIGNGFSYGSNTSPRPPKYNSETSDAYEEADPNSLDSSSKTDSASSQYDSYTGSPSNSYGTYNKNGSPVTAASKHGAGGSGGGGYGSSGYGSGGYGSGGYGSVKQEHPFGPDTLSFLSSLAPSLLLSSLLLPLAISTLLAASNTTLFGRKRREVDEEVFPLYDDLPAADIGTFNGGDQPKTLVKKESYIYKLLDSLEETMDENLSADQQKDTVAAFFRNRNLSDPNSKCLERLACLNSVQWTMEDASSSSHAVESLRTALDVAKSDGSFSSGVKERLSKGSSIGLIKADLCQKFECEETE